MIDLVEEPGAATYTLGTLDYSLTSKSSLATVHRTLLEKSNGVFYMMLWQDLPVFNRTANNNQGTEIINPPISATLTLNTSIAQARVFLPNNSASPVATYNIPGSLSLSIPDQMLIIELTPSDSLGDFNHDHLIDAADYTVWRKGLGTTYSQSDYNNWRAHFGQSLATGANARRDIAAAVPEPSCVMAVPIVVAAISLSIRRR